MHQYSLLENEKLHEKRNLGEISRSLRLQLPFRVRTNTLKHVRDLRCLRSARESASFTKEAGLADME